MDHAPLVLGALTVAWLGGRWNRHLPVALRAAGAHRPRRYRRGGEVRADRAPLVLGALIVVWLGGRWNRRLPEALRVAGAHRPQGYRRGEETVCVRVEVGYGVSLGVLRERVGVAVAGHWAWDGRGWGMQVVDATRGAVVVRVHATAGSRGGARQLEADLREVVGRDYPESPLVASLGDQGFAVPHQALER